MERRRVGLVGPILLLGLGVILLLNNLNILHWDFWDVIQLWPVLLVAAGIELLFGRRSVWGGIVAAVLVLGLIAGGIWVIGPEGAGSFTATGGRTAEIAYPLDGTSAVSVTLDPAVGDLTVGALVDSANLVEGTVRLQGQLQLDQRFTAGNPARLELKATTPSPVRVMTNTGGDWTLDLNPGVGMTLATDVGVGATTLDLTQLQASTATVDFGVGQGDIALPATVDSRITIDGGVGTIVVRVPASLGVRVRADTALVARTFPPGYTQAGEVFTSPNYDRADYRADLVVSLGIGTLTVQQGGQ